MRRSCMIKKGINLSCTVLYVPILVTIKRFRGWMAPIAKDKEQMERGEIDGGRDFMHRSFVDILLPTRGKLGTFLQLSRKMWYLRCSVMLKTKPALAIKWARRSLSTQYFVQYVVFYTAVLFWVPAPRCRLHTSHTMAQMDMPTTQMLP